MIKIYMDQTLSKYSNFLWLCKFLWHATTIDQLIIAMIPIVYEASTLCIAIKHFLNMLIYLQWQFFDEKIPKEKILFAVLLCPRLVQDMQKPGLVDDRSIRTSSLWATLYFHTKRSCILHLDPKILVMALPHHFTRIFSM